MGSVTHNGRESSPIEWADLWLIICFCRSGFDLTGAGGFQLEHQALLCAESSWPHVKVTILTAFLAASRTEPTSLIYFTVVSCSDCKNAHVGFRVRLTFSLRGSWCKTDRLCQDSSVDTYQGEVSLMHPGIMREKLISKQHYIFPLCCLHLTESVPFEMQNFYTKIKLGLTIAERHQQHSDSWSIFKDLLIITGVNLVCKISHKTRNGF